MILASITVMYPSGRLIIEFMADKNFLTFSGKRAQKIKQWLANDSPQLGRYLQFVKHYNKRMYA